MEVSLDKYAPQAYTQHMKRIAVYLGLVQYQQLKARSQHLGLPLAELIRRAIDAYLQQQQKQEE